MVAARGQFWPAKSFGHPSLYFCHHFCLAKLGWTVMGAIIMGRSHVGGDSGGREILIYCSFYVGISVFALIFEGPTPSN